MKENNNLIELIDKEVSTDIEYLKLLSPDTDKYAMAVDNIVKLYNLKQETEKVKFDGKNRMIDQVIEHSLDAAGIVLPLIFYGVWMKRGLKFEENGTFTSTTFKGLFQKFKPTRR